MTDTEIRIAVAECCGWRHDPAKDGWLEGQCYGIPPNDENQWMMFPNYPDDLNACASFREHLDNREQDLFAAHLGEATGGRRIDFGATSIDCTTAVVWATARQRCEAFLKVKGKWNE